MPAILAKPFTINGFTPGHNNSPHPLLRRRSNVCKIQAYSHVTSRKVDAGESNFEDCVTNANFTEYFELLTSYMKDEPRSNDAKATKRRVDEAAMWRHAYTQSEEIQLALRARISELERIHGKTAEDSDPVALKSTQKRRRKANEPSGASTSRSQKVPKVAVNAAAVQSTDAIVGGDIQGFETCAKAPLGITLLVLALVYADCPGDPILGGIYVLQQFLAQRTVEPTQLAATLCQTATNIRRYLSGIQGIQNFGNATARLDAIGKIFPKLLIGLDRLTPMPGGDMIEDQVVYVFIQILQVLLQRICEIAIAQAREQVAEASTRKLANSASGSSLARNAENPCSSCKERSLKCDARVPRCRNCSRLKKRCRLESSAPESVTTDQTPVRLDPIKAIMKLCELEITILGHLDLGNQAHAKVFQGFVCILYERIGHSLKRFVFGSQDDRPVQERSDSRPGTNQSGEGDDEAVEAQGPYLVWILERMQSILSRHSTLDNPTQSLIMTTSTDVTALTRIKLQNTLLKSVFGPEAYIQLGPCIQPPRTFADLDPEGLGLPPLEMKGWFKHAIWRLVGWDVLRNHIKWE